MRGAEESRGAILDEEAVEDGRLLDGTGSSTAMSLWPSSSSASTSIESDFCFVSVPLSVEGVGDGLAVESTVAIAASSGEGSDDYSAERTQP